MTDKEIIIDGADVSKCPDLMKEYLPSCYCSILDKENQEASCAGCFCLFKIKQYMNNNRLIEDLKYELKCRTAECEELEKLLKSITDDRIEKLGRAIKRRNSKIEKYEQAFDEIEKECKNVIEDENTIYQATGVCFEFLDIINKVKDRR